MDIRDKLERAGRLEEDAKQRLTGLAQANLHGLTREEHRNLAVAHRTAEAEWMAALNHRETVQREFAAQQEPLGADFERVWNENRGKLYRA